MALGCTVLFLLPFAAAGVFAAVQAIRSAQRGEWEQAGLLGIVSLAFGGVGLGGIAWVLAGRRQIEEAAARESRNPDDGKCLAAGRRIRDKREAEWLAASLRRAIGLS